jgi:hypothetical protein
VSDAKPRIQVVRLLRKANVKVFILTNVANGEDLIRRSCLGNDVMQNFTLIFMCLKAFKYLMHHLFTGGSLRGRGWKYGSGFVDGIFPVLSPIAQQILGFAQNDLDPNILWGSLDALPTSHTTWDDVINVVVQLRLNKQWDSIVLVRN